MCFLLDRTIDCIRALRVLRTLEFVSVVEEENLCCVKNIYDEAPTLTARWITRSWNAFAGFL